MKPFLRGFVDELTKVSQPSMPGLPPTPTAGGVVRPPSTANGSERPMAARAPGALGPGTDALRAIPTQRMESPGASRQQMWRPSPGYKPNPASDPKPPAPAPAKGKGRAAPSTAQPAWESSPQMHQRQNQEAAYNRTPRMGSLVQPMAAGSGGYHLRPGQAPTPAPAAARSAQVARPATVRDLSGAVGSKI